MHVSSEQHPILDRVNGSVPFIGRWNGDPTAVVRLIPVILICQREDMSDFEADPSPKARFEYRPASYNASTIALTYCITKRYDAGSGLQRKATQ